MFHCVCVSRVHTFTLWRSGAVVNKAAGHAVQRARTSSNSNPCVPGCTHPPSEAVGAHASPRCAHTYLLYLHRDAGRGVEPGLDLVAEPQDQEDAEARQHRQRQEDGHGDQDGSLQPGGGWREGTR